MAGNCVELPQTRINYLSDRALPQSLETLSGRHESLLRVVQYLESRYLLAAGSKADRAPLEKEAKLYLNEALTRVAADIDSAAASLEQYLSLEASAAESLARQVQGLQARLLLGKERGARARLEAFVANKSGAGPGPEVDDARVGVEASFSSRLLELPANSRRMSLAQHTPANVAKMRVPLAVRLARLDGVGLRLEGDGGDAGWDDPQRPELSVPMPIAAPGGSLISTASRASFNPDLTLTASRASVGAAGAMGVKTNKRTAHPAANT